MRYWKREGGKRCVNLRRYITYISYNRDFERHPTISLISEHPMSDDESSFFIYMYSIRPFVLFSKLKSVQA
jgi:hypothetical protein